MVVLDHSNQTATNVSTKTLVGERPRARGKMQYISGWGTNGIIVLIGGTQKLVTDTSDQNQGTLIPMESIDVFDVSSIYDDRVLGGGAWYKQNTTGDIPASRVDFCIFLARAVDTSSANMSIKGEENLASPKYQKPVLTPESLRSSGRYGHTCHRSGTRTMISVGGAPTTNGSSGPCDWQTKGINVFDMSTTTWGSKFEKTSGDYAVPNAVFARIGGNAQGNATMTAPAEGFAESGLAALFGSTSVAVSPAEFSSAGRRNTAHNRRVIIASSTVGGMAFLSITCAVMWFFRRTLHRILIGDVKEHLEMDGKGRQKLELPGDAVFWELPEAGPAELWSPTVSPLSPKVEDEFRFETRSDRELGWRGEIECLGDLAKKEYLDEKADQANQDYGDDRSSRHPSVEITCKELD
ncbi:MAG: hypothetical protein Q9216_000879 [Gyalolechia sp. 2 TL-2023]